MMGWTRDSWLWRLRGQTYRIVYFQPTAISFIEAKAKEVCGVINERCVGGARAEPQVKLMGRHRHGEVGPWRPPLRKI
jgi:hypothetical protein